MLNFFFILDKMGEGLYTVRGIIAVISPHFLFWGQHFTIKE